MNTQICHRSKRMSKSQQDKLSEINESFINEKTQLSLNLDALAKSKLFELIVFQVKVMLLLSSVMLCLVTKNQQTYVKRRSLSFVNIQF